MGAVGLGATLGGCATAPDYPSGPLRVATGAPGGVYYVYGRRLAAVVRDKLPRLRPEVISTAASIDNLRLVAHGHAELAFTLADSASLAYLGRPREDFARAFADSFDRPLPVVALAELYDNSLHLVVRADSPADTSLDPTSEVDLLTELTGRAVSLGPIGSGTELAATRLLTVAGVDAGSQVRLLRLDLEQSVAELAARELDAFFFSGGIPVAAIEQLAGSVPVRLVDLGSYVSGLRRHYGEVYAPRTIPASAYGLDEPVTTVGVPNYLVAAETMDERLAYHLTRTLFDSRRQLEEAHAEARRLDRRTAINTAPLPLHPGAERYYRERKR